MDQEKWDELMNLRGKASLNPKTDYRFEQLENYLSDLHAFNIFLQKDHKKFQDQLNKLSEQERQDLFNRVESKTIGDYTFHKSSIPAYHARRPLHHSKPKRPQRRKRVTLIAAFRCDKGGLRAKMKNRQGYA